MSNSLTIRTAAISRIHNFQSLRRIWHSIMHTPDQNLDNMSAQPELMEFPATRPANSMCMSDPDPLIMATSVILTT